MGVSHIEDFEGGSLPADLTFVGTWSIDSTVAKTGTKSLKTSVAGSSVSFTWNTSDTASGCQRNRAWVRLSGTAAATWLVDLLNIATPPFGTSHYDLRMAHDAAKIMERSGGVTSELAAVAATFSLTEWYRPDFETFAGNLRGKFQRASDGYWLNSSGTWQATETWCVTVSGDFTVTGPAKFGLGFNQAAGGGMTLHVDDLEFSQGETLSPGDANLVYSPTAWEVNGTSWIQSNTVGNAIKAKFTGTECYLEVDVSHLVTLGIAAGRYPYLSYRIDGSAWTRVQLTSSSTILTLSNSLAAGTHEVEVLVSAIDPYTDSTSIWAAIGSYSARIKRFIFGADAVISAPTVEARNVLVLADSEGAAFNAAGTGNPAGSEAIDSFARILAHARGAELTLLSYSGTGYSRTNSGVGAPAAPGTSGWFKNYRSGTARDLTWTPDEVWLCLGPADNSIGELDADVQAGAQTLISDVRTAYPAAKVFVVTMPGGHKRSAIAAAVAASAADTNRHVIDAGTAWDSRFYGANPNTYTSDSIHYSTRGQALVAALLANGARQVLEGTGGVTRGFIIGG